MSAHQSEWFRPRVTRPAGERKFRLLAAGAAILFLAYLAATLAGAPRQASSLIFSVAVLPVPFLGWWAYLRAPANLRRTWLFGAWAATLWLAGSLVWYAFFLADGSVVPTPPGVWDFFFAGAQLCLIMAVVVSMRSFALARIAAADTAVIASAGVALGAAFISRGLEGHVSAATITTLNRPLLGIVTLMLIAAAALASWDGIPSSLVLLGLGEVGLIVGDLVYSYAAVQGHYDNDRWANLGWSAGAAGAMLAASTIILGIDRPASAARPTPCSRPSSRFTRGPSRESHRDHGDARRRDLRADWRPSECCPHRDRGQPDNRDRDGLPGTGLLRTAEHAAELLDSAVLESERARDELHSVNAQLRKANTDQLVAQLAVAEAFNLIDERTQGRLRAVVEEAGGDLAALVEESLD